MFTKKVTSFVKEKRVLALVQLWERLCYKAEPH